jgi:GGDEF domain-containing protein
MPNAFEALEEIRKSKQAAAPQAVGPRPNPLDALAEIRSARVQTRLLDSLGLTSEEVKRRAAAGEPIVQSGLRPPTEAQESFSAGVKTLGGMVEGTLQAAALPFDIPITASKFLRGDRSEKFPIAGAITGGTDRAIRAINSAVGIDDGVALSGAGDVARFGANVLAPGPEVAAAMRPARGRTAAAPTARIAQEAPKLKQSEVIPAVETQHRGLSDSAASAADTPRSPLDALDEIREQKRLGEAAVADVIPDFGASTTTTGKPLWEMSPDDLHAEYETARAADADVLTTLFGEDGAKRYNYLERRANGTMDRAAADAAYEELQAMENALSESQRNRLFGIGDTGATPDEVREFLRGIEGLDDSSPAALGDSLRWALTKLEDGKEIAEMGQAGRVAAAQLRRAHEIALSNGWNPQDVMNAAIRGAAGRFDPADAPFMLRRFMKSDEAEIPSNRRISAYEIGEDRPADVPTTQHGGSPITSSEIPSEAFVPERGPETPPPVAGGVADQPTIEELMRLAFEDEVTGLANLRGWKRLPERAVKAYVDLDNLKPINDTFGHEAGDSLIRIAAKRLKEAADEIGADVARRSGDEFYAQFDSSAELEAALARANENLRQTGVVYVAPDGQRYTIPQEYIKGFSHGLADSVETAEVVARQSKLDRAAAGIRTERRVNGEVDRRVSDAAGSNDGRAFRGAADSGQTVPPQLAFRDQPPPSGGGRVPPNDGDSPPPPFPPGGGDDPFGKYAEPSAVNLDRLNIDDDAKRLVVKTAEEMRPELERAKGRSLSNAEVIEAALTSDILQRGTSRQATEKAAAALLKTRQHLAALAETGDVTREFIETLATVSSHATASGRALQALKIGADPVLSTIQGRVIQNLLDAGHEIDVIVKAAEGVDFTDARQVTEFFRKFVKPRLWDVIDEYRYINLLSSPKTHITNALSNALQSVIVRPAVRFGSGVIDAIESAVTGKEREYFVKQVPAYYRGLLNSLDVAAGRALESLRGSRALTLPDVDELPTGAKLLRPFQFIPRALEAGDVFFRTLVEAGEVEALTAAQRWIGKPANKVSIAQRAADTAAESVFRKPLDPMNKTGQGHLLANIDKATTAVQYLRKVKVVKWFVPFVETPMNILKQGIELSPLGLATLPGNTRKTEQLAKAMIGSTVFMGAGILALQGRSTWAVPRGKKERAAFYAAGLQPYALKVGDTWVNYSRLGPLAYPIAMAAAMKHYSFDDPKAPEAFNGLVAASVMRGVAEFFSDQSYVQGIGDLIAAVRGDDEAWARAASTIPRQFVPLDSLQRWVANVVDPIYRKSERGFSWSAVLDNIKKDIPVVSKSLPAYEDLQGNPARRQMPLTNALSPFTVSHETDEIDTYRAMQEAAKTRARRKAEREN